MAATPSAPEFSKPLAIVGLACRLPGADNLDEFWQLLLRGGSDLGELPPERFDRELVFDPERGARAKSYSSIGGVCRSIPFDAAHCPVPPEMIKDLDEAHLALCEVAADACRSGNLDPFNLPQRHTGVYVGHTRGTSRSGDITYGTLVETTAQYLREIEAFRNVAPERLDELVADVVTQVRSEMPQRNEDGGPDLSASMAAGLISLAFGLDGPYCSLNAACASSLQAMALGARALQLGEIDMAIVGGASHCKSDSLVLFSQARSVSDTGSRPFDADADGLVTSEGYVVLLLKTLERALADGNEVFAVIRGIGVSSDGRGKSLWAPRKEGQIEAIHRAYGAGVDMSRVQYIEAHATSTQVGDATEISALAEAMRGKLPPGTRIPVGSVKANVGHTLETAGMAGLVKTILAMRNEMIPPQINLRNLNPKIDWDHIPFFVPTQALDWKSSPDGHPRRAAVNAFGIGGLNVHVVVDEFIPDQARKLIDESLHDRSEGKGSAQCCREPIAIVGAGAVLPGALTIDKVWELFASGRREIHELPADRWNPEVSFEPGSRSRWKSPTKLVGCIRDFSYDWKRHKVPPKQIGAADPLQFMLLDAVDQAFRTSGYHERPFDRKRTGVLVGTVFGGDFANQLQMGLRLPNFERSLKQVLNRHGVTQEIQNEIATKFGDLLLQHMPALDDETGSFTSSTLASRITKSFDLMGGAAAVDGNAPSALAVLAACIDQLRTREVDMMVCAAGQRALGLPMFAGLSLSGLLARGEPHAPFDLEADGYVPGEGVGVVLLKRLADAERDGDTVLGIIHGVGIARGPDLPTAIATGARRSLEAAQVDPRDVTCLEAGSTGVPALDRQELAGIAKVYGNSRELPLLLGSAIGQLGFSAGCSGMTSLVKAMYELQATEVTPHVGLTKPAPLLREHGDLFSIEPSSQHIPVAHAEGRLFAAVNSFGKWNLAYHAILERPTPVPLSTNATRRRAVPPPILSVADVPETSSWRIVRFQARTLTELRRIARDAIDSRDRFVNDDNNIRFQLDQHRLAIVTDSAQGLEDGLDLFCRHAEDPGSLSPLDERGVIYGKPRSEAPKVAILFAGQGSQYAGMMRPLVEQEAAVSEALDEIDADLGRLGFPRFADFVWNDPSPLGRDVWLTQLSLLIADTLMYRAIQTLGMRADRIAGHSFGEFPALVASEAWTFSDAARATYARCRAVEGCSGERGGMLAISGASEEVRRWIGESRGELYISHVNAPQQTVVSGEEAAVRQLASQLQQQGVSSKLVPVPRPFHTPLMGNARKGFASELEEVPLEPPRIPLLSSVTNRYVAEPLDIRRNLVQQLVTPVNYVKLIERLADEGVQVFIEAGPRQILTRLNKQILVGREVTVVACDHPKRSGIPQLLHVQASYEVAGGRLGETRRTTHAVGEHILKSVDVSRQDTFQAAVSDVRESTRERTVERLRVDYEAVRETGTHGEPVERPISGASRLPLPPGDRIATEQTFETKVGENADQVPESPLATLVLEGTPYDRGRIHGSTRRAEIRRVLRRNADAFTNKIVNTDAVLEAVRHADTYFDPDALEELRGMAVGAGVPVESLIALNLHFYPDIAAGCCQFAVRAEINGEHSLLQCANEDLPIGLVLRDILTRHIQVVQPTHGMRYVTIPIAGQVGALSGMNTSGIAVTSAMLLDLPRRPDAAPGRLHGLIVRDILARADSVEAALKIVQGQRKVGAWSLCITHFPSDSIVLIEYDGSDCRIARSREMIIASNHTQLHSGSSETPEHSHMRLQRLAELLGRSEQAEVSPSRLRDALRDLYDGRRARTVSCPTMNTVRRVDNQMSVVFQPAVGRAWVNVSGSQTSLPDQYFQLDLHKLLRRNAASTTKGRTRGLQHEPANHHASSDHSNSTDAILGRESRNGTAAGRKKEQYVFRHVISEREFITAARSLHGGPPVGSPDRVCQRFVMRMMESPLDGASLERRTFQGAALILGDNTLGRALAARLRAEGSSVSLIPTDPDPAKVIAEIDRCWKMNPSLHLFLTTPYDAQAETFLDEPRWDNRRKLGVSTPYFALQHWYQLMLEAGLLDKGSVVACTRMGGDFGFSDVVPTAESGALSGLMKALSVEVGRDRAQAFRDQSDRCGRRLDYRFPGRMYLPRVGQCFV
jgi:acyl transferase domain-containing protein